MKLLRNQRGQGMVEYILIVALVVVGAIALWSEFGTNLKSMLKNANSAISNAGELDDGN
jgi:pilus assembly protein Flp/PilA